MKVTYFKINGVDLYTSDMAFYPRNLFNLDAEAFLNSSLNNGKIFNYAKINERKFIVNGIIKSNVYSNILKITALVNDNQLKKIEMGVEGLPNIFINAYLVNIATQEPWNNEISMQFIAPDPYIYSVDIQNIILGSVSASSLTYPIKYPISYGAVTGGQGTVTNLGNAVAYPIITVVGTCSNFTITNQNTGEIMSFNIPLGVNDTLVIDNNISTRGIYLNGVLRMDLKNGNWIKCLPGNSIFSFTRSSLESKQHCTVSLQSRWL